MFSKSSEPNDGPYLSGLEAPEVPTPGWRRKAGFKKDPLTRDYYLQTLSDTFLKPVRKVSEDREEEDTSSSKVVDSPLSSSFKPVQKYLKTPPTSITTTGSTSENSIYQTCSQAQPIPIHVVAHNLRKLRKVGEGVFGEVYLGKFGNNSTSRIFKIVAIEGKKLVNDQKQRKFHEIESEIVVSQYLNKLQTGYKGCYSQGFGSLRNARICQGRYPPKLLQAWRAYNTLGCGQNDKPDYTHKQFYAVFEYDFCGIDMCMYHFETQKQSLSIVLQVAFSLAAAESACQFEHRDLHWGNVLIQPTHNLYNTYTINGRTYRIPCCGISSSIIDFSISRITNEQNVPVFLDLANDDEQFTGPEKIQFDVYKRMKKMTRNKWQKYTPKSNILWIHYLTTKFLTDAAYTNADSDEHYKFTKDMRKLRTGITKYKSCTESVELFLQQFVTELGPQ